MTLIINCHGHYTVLPKGDVAYLEEWPLSDGQKEALFTHEEWTR